MWTKNCSSQVSEHRHEYEDVAARRIWRTVTVNLPALTDAIAHELKRNTIS